MIVTPDTVLRWQRRCFREHWTKLSGRPTRGRPPINPEITALVTRMAAANPFWGAPRIHGELLKIGIRVAERTVSRLVPRRRIPPSQTWRTFLTNHVRDLVSLDFFTVPTARLRVLFVLGELHLRRILTRYFAYYHRARTHLSLDKDAPDGRPIEPPELGMVIQIPEVGGLHHRYLRQAA